MNKISFLFFAVLAISLVSCTEDLGKTEVTYTKATAIYGDINDIRSAPLVAESRAIVDPGKVYVSEDLLLIGEEGKGIHVFDNSNPEAPSELYFMNIPENREFYVTNNKIYAESLYDVVKIDISNRQAPVIDSRVENAFTTPQENGQGQSIVGFEYRTVTEELDRSSGLWELANTGDPIFFDFSERLIPASNVPASFAGSSGSSIGTVNRIAHTKDHLYIISNSIIYSFRDDTEFEKVSENSIGWAMETIYPKDDALFIGTQNSMEILSITDPDNPSWISNFSHATSCDPVLPTDETAYVTLRSGNECDGNVDALIAIDIQSLTRLEAIQEIEMESPYGMTIINGQLYVGEGENGLKVFDILEDNTLELVDFDKSIQAYDVIPHPTRADVILIASPEGFGQYQITTTNKKLLSWISA